MEYVKGILKYEWQIKINIKPTDSSWTIDRTVLEYQWDIHGSVWDAFTSPRKLAWSRNKEISAATHFVNHGWGIYEQDSW